MTTTTAIKRLPWQDHWTQPTEQQLLEPLNAQHRGALSALIERVEALEQVQRSLVWYGPGWNWTIQFDQPDPSGGLPETLCYVVPNNTLPLVCVPLTTAVIERLPLRRLHKFVRTGVRAAKRAVEIHWANWNLTSVAEAEQLMDLIRRRHRIVQEIRNSSSDKRQ